MPDRLMTRRAGPASVDREARTARAIASTFADVQRAAPAPDGAFVAWTERLDPAGMDLSRFIGAPLLADHENRTSALAGVVEAAERAPKGLEVLIRFAASPLGDEALGLVADGVLRGVSIGYSVAEWRAEPARDGRPIFSAARWAPLELSLTPIPADAGARFRAAAHQAREDEGMTETTTKSRDDAAEAVRAERHRVATLREVADVSSAILERGAIAEAERQAVEGGWSPERFRAALLDLAVKAGEKVKAPTLTPVSQFGRSYDDPAWQIQARAEALAAQIMRRAPAPEAAPLMASAGFSGMARDMLEAAGIRTARMSNAAVMDAALRERAFHVTDDFPALLKATGDRMLAGLREAAPSPIQAVCQARSVADFRPFQTIGASGPTVLAKLGEGGEVTHTTIFESSEAGQLATYARNVSITRQALVNDDLQVFASAARLWASGIAETERRLFLAMFEVNTAGGGGWGPTMADGEPLWSVAHDNTTSGQANTAGIAAGRKALREQRDLNGNLLALAPAVLLSGPTSETGLEQAVSSITIATAEATRPIFGGMGVAVEAGIAGPEFFAFAPPAASPVLEYVTLDGRGGAPSFETFTGPNHDGVVMRCIHDVAIVAAGWIGAVRVSGS